MKHQMGVRTRSVLAVGVLLGLVACGSVPPPTTQVAKADSAMQAAELAGAREYAPIELRAAEASKQDLEKALAAEKYERAARLAEKTRAEAELAKATAEAEKARLALQESRDNIDTMVREVGRVAGE